MKNKNELKFIDVILMWFFIFSLAIYVACLIVSYAKRCENILLLIENFISYLFSGGILGYIISKYVVQEPIKEVVESYAKPYDEKDNNFCDKVKEHMDKLQQEIERNFKFNKKVDVDKYRQKILSDFNSIYHKTTEEK